MKDAVLKFWFEDIDASMWWQKDQAFDQLLEQKFGQTLQQACCGELHTWRSDARGRLAEIIVLDQFSRNIYRDSALAFAQDAMALVLAQEAVAAGLHLQLAEVERTFLLMPYMHSESALIHEQAEQLYRDYAPAKNYEFELRHKAIIDRFGRYPHRNEVLGRVSTAEEIEFLKQPGSSF